ncbi:MAG: rhomboid family intramembrane serine protease [Phycisphaerae bacterium]|nr:rhomboid family intramembrane serine protease [Phycisphaerae bacterium]
MLIPLKVDVPMCRQPLVNYALIAIIVCVSIAGFTDDDLFCKLAGIKIETVEVIETVEGELFFINDIQIRLSTDDFPLPVLAITSSFLHAGFLHLIGNMLFLWVFGNAVNYKFGHLGYLGLYVAAALAGGMAHYVFDGGPVVGASGAVYGVMGAFLVYFLRNDITVFWIIWIRPGVSTLSSGWIILFWIAWDVLFLGLGAENGVALWGHVGGFAAGFAIAMLCAWTGWIKPTQDEQTLLQVFGIRP